MIRIRDGALMRCVEKLTLENRLARWAVKCYDFQCYATDDIKKCLDCFVWSK